VGAHILKPARCLPPEFAGRGGRVGITLSDVAWTPGDDLVRDGPAAGPLEGLDDLQDGVALSSTKVDGPGARRLVHALERCQMTQGEVDHMDVVAHAGAVGGGIVAAEYR